MKNKFILLQNNLIKMQQNGDKIISNIQMAQKGEKMKRVNKLEENFSKEEKTSTILEKYIPNMYKVAKTRLYNEEDIYDAIQETAYKLYINIEKINDANKIKIWLIKVLINECNKIYRNKKREIKLQEKVTKELLDMIELADEHKVDFEILLQELKSEDRTILALYYGDNYTTKEISSILNKNENTIRSRIKRAKEQIKRKVEEGENYE